MAGKFGVKAKFGLADWPRLSTMQVLNAAVWLEFSRPQLISGTTPGDAPV
jgi:hypothetical protein